MVARRGSVWPRDVMVVDGLRSGMRSCAQKLGVRSEAVVASICSAVFLSPRFSIFWYLQYL